MNVQVKAEAVTNIHGIKQLYVVIETPKGKVIITIGEKNYTKLTDILKEEKPK